MFLILILVLHVVLARLVKVVIFYCYYNNNSNNNNINNNINKTSKNKNEYEDKNKTTNKRKRRGDFFLKKNGTHTPNLHEVDVVASARAMPITSNDREGTRRVRVRAASFLFAGEVCDGEQERGREEEGFGETRRNG